MLLEQCAFQIWSWSISDLQNSFRLWMVQDHYPIPGPYTINQGQNLPKATSAQNIVHKVLEKNLHISAHEYMYIKIWLDLSKLLYFRLRGMLKASRFIQKNISDFYFVKILGCLHYYFFVDKLFNLWKVLFSTHAFNYSVFYNISWACVTG